MTRTIVAVAAALTVIGGGLNCTKTLVEPPAVPSALVGPAGDSTLAGAVTYFRVVTVQPQGESVRYVLDWDDGAVDTSGTFASAAVAVVSHAWASAGTFVVRDLAFVASDESLGSGWSEPLSVRVLLARIEPPGAPNAPLGETGDRAFVGRGARFRVVASQPQSESLVYVLDWGDGSADTTPAAPSGVVVSAYHWWAATGTFTVKALAAVARDPAIASAWSDPTLVRVVRSGKDVTTLVPGDNEVSGWTRSSAMQVAETATQLEAIIDGEAVPYENNHFVKCAFQNYSGDVGGTQVELDLRIFDMGDTTNARNVYAEVAAGTEVPWTGDNPGVEAHTDESSLFAYRVEFRDDRFYFRADIMDKSTAAQDVAKLFARTVDAAICDTTD